MLPDTLAGWTLAAIEQVLTLGVFEGRTFDFKESLPPSPDEKGKLRVRKSVCAFANSSGGFLIIGVKDDRALPVKDRLVGIDATVDVPQHFGSLLGTCVPRPDFSQRNPPLHLPNGRLIHVLHVPESRQPPHGVFDGERWVFPKRTDGGNELLSYEELRSAFRDRLETRQSLRVAQVEVERMRKHAYDLNVRLPWGNAGHELPLMFRPALLETTLLRVLADVKFDDSFLDQLALLRGAAYAADEEVARLMAEGGDARLLTLLVQRILSATQIVSTGIQTALARP